MHASISKFKRRPSLRTLAAAVFALPVLALIAPGAADAAWKPTRNVELLVPAGVGGGNDRAARMVHRILKKYKFLPTSVSVVNKPGAGGTIAYAYLNQFKGDAHHIALYPTSLLTRPISGRSDITFRQLTPLGHMFNEYSVVMVRNDSPIKSGVDLLQRLKKDIHSTSFAIGTSRVNTNGMALAAVLNAVGLDYRNLRVLTHKSGGKSYAAVLGGHVDVYGTSVGSAQKRLKKGKMRGIAISSPTQLGGDVTGIKTWKEQGADIEFFGLRGLLGPGGLSADQIAYWDSVIAKVVKTKEFKAYAKKSGAVINYKNSKDTRIFMEKLETEWTALMKKFGLVKKKKKKKKM